MLHVRLAEKVDSEMVKLNNKLSVKAGEKVQIKTPDEDHPLMERTLRRYQEFMFLKVTTDAIIKSCQIF